jgi:hypothetical protein
MYAGKNSFALRAAHRSNKAKEQALIGLFLILYHIKIVVIFSGFLTKSGMTKK